ncbi:MAG: T9SS type A sorting domain-containing protein [Chitinophagales bacterium]|nr:T9SS type A sorting domain-containing protein [Chitinophagales bacterium]
MKTKFYFITLIAALLAGFQTLAQSNNNSGPMGILFQETFGKGNNKTSLPSGRTTYSYNSGSSISDGEYHLYKKTNGRSEWHASNDHTGDGNGRAMVINASYAAGEFYRDTVTGLTSNSYYSIYLYVMNVNTLGTCGSSALLPRLQFVVEAYNANGTFTQLTSFTSQYIAQSANATWVQVGGTFTLGAGQTSVRYRIINNQTGGCGNDLAIDDITFERVMSTLPVTGLQTTAIRNNNDVNVKWQTLTESNTSHFVVEKSTNGKDWEAIGTVAAAGNSIFKKEYSLNDTKPAADNYYRIQQVDIDGTFTYSNVVTIKVNATVIKASTYPNPFTNGVQVDIKAETNQSVIINLYDLNGKVVKQLNAELRKGSNSVAVNDLKNIPAGMYLLDITSREGQSIYKTKLMKQ